MRNLFARVVFFAFAALLPLEAAADGEKIAEIRIAGNRRIETPVVLGGIVTRAGDTLKMENVDADIRGIYRLGHFEDVTVSSEPTDKGAILTYTVKEKPVVREIKFEGNKEISSDKLKEGLDVKLNAVFSRKDLDKALRKIRKQYGDEGYYTVEVTADSAIKLDTDVIVTFKINEGEKILIRDIEFEGAKTYSQRKLRGVIETKEKWFLSWLTGAGTYKDDVLKNDTAILSDFYMNNGFINVKVGEPKVSLLEDKSGLKVIFPLVEGDQFRLGDIGFKGELLVPATELREKLQQKSGELFSRAKLRADIAALTDAYADKGYAFTNVVPGTRVDPEKHILDITFEFEKGEKVYIDRINISGNLKTRDKVVRREMRVGEGELFSSTGLKRSKQNLMNLGYFEEVNITTPPAGKENHLNVGVEVKEKPTGTFSIGAGYSSLDGIVGQGAVQQANFLGLGLKANLAASLGSKSQTYNLGLTDPHFLDSEWTLGGDIYRSERQYVNFTRRSTGADIKGGYSLSDEVGTFFLYKFEKKEIFDITAVDPANPLDPNSTTSSIYGSITRNTTDYRLDPSRGMVNTFSLEFAGLGGTNRFLRYQGETTVFFPLPLSTVISARGVLGYIQSMGKPIPRDEKYLLGGISTIRGYPSRTISPIVPVVVPVGNFDEETRFDYIGGNKEAIFNVELLFPLIKEAGVKGVLFYDAGNSYGAGEPLFSRFLTSYGGGIRWFSPIGPLRLEYGIPLNPRPGIDTKSGKLEFSIGGFF